ncbi:ABC transporter ATP-binding protein [Pararobbsia silviterrae]|uniref:ABC transporter ATP-binding protein n=1 Tax=Pararobbsia silviterrae TaxID=1792498 RepID=A0A494Y962_9BURK|nr:ABC transporter ATP-binding protein [Pararobbsia silviterrae]RKP58886.1 ABC transporter ATP-binding protein [Pararobbsia silviterrae]
MSNVSVRNLDIVLGGNAIIEKLNLDVEEGEFVVLLGPSGCGKSTLLHSIAGLIDATDGTIEIGGKDMTWADPKDRQIGLVFQSYALYPTMNVERNMSFGLRINGTPKPEIERRVKRAAEILHLEPLLKRKPAQLSGGQRQRVAIGRAIVREADVFLFDEPLSNLDAKLRTELRRELKQLHKTLGSTMIYVTHDQVEAMTLATRIAVMRGGVIQQIGAPAAVYEKPANLFVAGFLGSPGMNFLEGKLERGGNGYVFRSGDIAIDVSHYAFAREPALGATVTAGVRPEDLHVALGDAKYRGTVSLIEPMGNHHVVWFDYAGKTFSSIAGETETARLDESIGFTIDPRNISLFDQASGQRI